MRSPSALALAAVALIVTLAPAGCSSEDQPVCANLPPYTCDGGTVADRIALMRSLPAVPLARQALRELGPTLRAAARRA